MLIKRGEVQIISVFNADDICEEEPKQKKDKNNIDFNSSNEDDSESVIEEDQGDE